MFWLILTLTLILSVVLIVMVLLQPSKGGGITAAFGGVGGSLGSTFGTRRTLEALGKGTTWTAVVIAALCIIANVFFVRPTGSSNGNPIVTSGESGAASSAQPVAPAPAPVQSTTPAPAAGEQQGQAAPAEAPSGDAPADNGGE